METLLYKHSFKLPKRSLTALDVYNAGLQRCEAGYAWGPGVRDHYLIHHVSEGHGTYTLRGITYALRAGDVFLSPPDETIHYAADAHMPWSYRWVGFNGLEAKALLSGTGFSKEQPVLHFDESVPDALLSDIYQARGSQPFQALQMTGRLYLFLAWLQQQAKEEPMHRLKPGEEYVIHACAFIANNFANPITVEDIASHVGVCRSRLYRAFQEHMNASPTRYLTRFRMQHACALLSKGGLSVKEIAFSVGFEDPLYFSRRFREIIGSAPTEYTKECT